MSRTYIVIALIAFSSFFPVGIACHAECVRPFSVEALPDAKPWEKTAAQELRDYLGRVALDGKITVDGLGDVVFHVGDTEFAAGKGMSSANFQSEEWAIKSFGRDVVLNGGGTRGCLYAVYHFLEDFCDVRWWMDGDEDVPPAKPLALPALDSRGKPHFFYRDVYRSKKDDFRTAARNRLNGNGDSHISPDFGGGEVFGPPYHCHTWRMHIPWAKYGKDHPEWFALVNGKRTGHKKTQLCLSCPDLPAVMAARIEEQIAKGEAEARARGLPPPRLYDMSMNDGHGFCECAPCKASQEKYGISGDQLIFENKVAAMLAKKHPDLLFSVFAYYQGEAVPKNGVRAADNIVVKLCNTRQNMAAGIFEPDNKFMHDQVSAWRSYAKHLFIWEYSITFRKETAGFPFASEFYLGEKLRYYADNGVMGLLVEHERPEKNDFYELKYHILARFLENPYLDARAVTEDFMRRYYGAAAPHLMETRRYLDNIRRANSGFVTWFPNAFEFSFVDNDDCRKMAAMWDKAEAAVKDDAKRLARVRRARRGFDDMRATCAAAQPAMADAEAGVSDVPFLDFPAEKKAFTLHDSRIAYVDDPEAKGGKAVHAGYLSEHFKMPFQIGVYSQALRKNIRSRSWKTALGEGYHWYELGKVEFPKVPSYIFLTRSWTIQVAPWDRRILGMTGNVKAHVKFTPEGVWVDRVVIIPNN